MSKKEHAVARTMRFERNERTPRERLGQCGSQDWKGTNSLQSETSAFAVQELCRLPRRLSVFV